MAETYNRLNLDVNVKPGGIITAVQKDSDSRYLDVTLFNNGVPIDLTGHEVRIYMCKPENGGEIFNDGEITEPENGRCQFLLTTAALEKVGHLQTQISIWKDNKEILSTQIFEIMVTESLRTTGSIEGSNEYGALVVLFQNLYESMDLMTDMVQNFGTAGAVAAGIPADTFWKMLEAVYQVNKDALENASAQGVLDKIGTSADTGGTPISGTVMAKENAIMRLLSLADSKQIWGRWVQQGTKSISVSLAAGETKTQSIVIPANTWFSYLYIGKLPTSADIGANIATKIGGITYSTPTRNETGYSGWHYAFTLAGLQPVKNMNDLAEYNATVGANKSLNTNYELIPLFPYFAEETEVTVTMKNTSNSSEETITWTLYYLAEVQAG